MAAAFSLTEEQTVEFERSGMLRVAGFFPQRMMAEMAGKIWTDLQHRFGIDRDRRETWTLERPAQYQALIRAGAFDALGSGFAALSDALMGHEAWERPRHLGQPLVTFPTASWVVPHRHWHVDLPATDSIGALPIIRVFVLLEPVRSRGGGTCYVQGSHRVIADCARRADASPRSSDVKVLLKNEPWFAALFTQTDEDRERMFMIDGGEARGIEVRVKEVVGESGDIYVMHPAMLHTIAPNALDRPRMMLVQAIQRRD